MKKLFLLVALFGMLNISCTDAEDENLNQPQNPTVNPEDDTTPEDTPIFTIDNDGTIIVAAEGSEINVVVTTNLEYSVTIPTDAEEWLSVADSRAEVREETLTFIIAENNTFEERSASVEFVDYEGEVLQTIAIIQDAAILPDNPCPSNEIWYTNGSTTEPTIPYDTSAFGVNITSNSYDTEKECWVIKFDGDVTRIGDFAFVYCDSLTSVTIPDSVTSIGDFAFVYCDSLTSVTIGDSVTTIGIQAFDGCSSLTSVTIPDSVTTIGDYAFRGCRSLTSVTIPDSVTTIGNDAFFQCVSLTSVTIPDSVTTIGVRAFYGCSSLTSATIGEGVTTIGLYAFYDCSSLTSVIIGDSVTTIEHSAFMGCSSLTSITIPDSVTTIGYGVFGYCSSLTEFRGKYASEDGRCVIIDSTLNSFAPAGLTEYTIPDSVTTIADWAFQGCDSLTSITIPNSVTTIGGNPFSRCTGLTEINGKYASEDGRCLIIDGVLNSFAPAGLTEYTIPVSVTSIGGWAFSECSNLISITIPNSVTAIRDSAFYNCWSLTSINISDLSAWCEIDFGYDANPLQNGANLYLNNELVTDLVIPSDISKIKPCAFHGCSSLTSVTIPDSVTTIGDYAFCYCSSLTSVTIPEGVTTIGERAVGYCSSLTSITIPNSVTKIRFDAFSDCSSLTSVYCKATTPPDIQLEIFYNNASGRKIYVPMESVKAYKSDAGWWYYANDIVGYNF